VQIIGVTGNGVAIRYKLVQPAARMTPASAPAAK
jgi:hypothetical protein